MTTLTITITDATPADLLAVASALSGQATAAAQAPAAASAAPAASPAAKPTRSAPAAGRRAKAAAPAATPEKTAPAEPDERYTELQTVARALVKDGLRDQMQDAVAVVADGKRKLADVPPERYDELMEAFAALSEEL